MHVLLSRGRIKEDDLLTSTDEGRLGMARAKLKRKRRRDSMCMVEDPILTGSRSVL